MLTSNLEARTAGLLALACSAAFLPTAMGQPPTAARQVASQKVETDADRLQGKWRIMSIAVEDKVVKRGDAPRAWKGTFEKDLFVDGNRFGQVGYSNANIKLDETRVPKQLTIADDDGKLTYRGIYALDGDTLKVCLNGDGADVRRPEEFATKKGTPLLLIVLKKSPADNK